MELDTVSDLEGVGLAVAGRLWQLGAEIADKIGCRGRVFRIDPDERAVKGGGRMDGRVGGLAVTVKARRQYVLHTHRARRIRATLLRYGPSSAPRSLTDVCARPTATANRLRPPRSC